ncbi:MAG: Ku protein [Candidatus Bathyarchaeota archaeon]|nr:Ku protein [Candidatus Bathyarchaeum tardum]
MEKTKAEPPKRSIWSGRISIGLVNVPVKLYTMIRDNTISFRYLHKNDGSPLKYQKVCVLDQKVIPWEEVVKGYEINKNEFVIFTKEELDAIRPESDERIRIDKFVNLVSIDPIYFDKSYILAPNKSKDAYNLMLTAFQKMGMAGVGKFTMKNKEHPVIIHDYRGSLILTILRYANEIVNPLDVEELNDLPSPTREELQLATKIIENLSGEFDITKHEDGFRVKVEKLIEKKKKGETIVPEKPQREEAKELMVALRETLTKIEQK